MIYLKDADKCGNGESGVLYTKTCAISSILCVFPDFVSVRDNIPIVWTDTRRQVYLVQVNGNMEVNTCSPGRTGKMLTFIVRLSSFSISPRY